MDLFICKCRGYFREFDNKGHFQDKPGNSTKFRVDSFFLFFLTETSIIISLVLVKHEIEKSWSHFRLFIKTTPRICRVKCNFVSMFVLRIYVRTYIHHFWWFRTKFFCVLNNRPAREVISCILTELRIANNLLRIWKCLAIWYGKPLPFWYHPEMPLPQCAWRLETAWYLQDNCLIIAWKLSNNCLTTAWTISKNCRINAR